MRDGYDSPLEARITSVTDSVSRAIAGQTDDAVLKAVWRLGIDVDRDKLLQALTADRERYREAYRRGYADAKSHASWIEVYEDTLQCSACGMTWTGRTDFCPSCGAMMDMGEWER